MGQHGAKNRTATSPKFLQQCSKVSPSYSMLKTEVSMVYVVLKLIYPVSYINFLKHFLNLFFLQKVQKTCQETNKKVQFTTKKRGQETNKKKNQ